MKNTTSVYWQKNADDVARVGSGTDQEAVHKPNVVNTTEPVPSLKVENLADIVIIDERSFIRECMGQSLRSVFPNRVLAFPGIDSWLETSSKNAVGVVILSVKGRPLDPTVQVAFDKLLKSRQQVPVILLCDAGEPDQIVAALEKGARGYLITSISLEVAAQAVRLVMAGGVFIPASSLIAARQMNNRAATTGRFGNEVLTARQTSIVEALCRGKANKVIAHELNMCESTVKVHVRNIMKKLRAKNRTEVAFIANGLLNDYRTD
jgi:DNA-binding NarL/FixJ family response regulator